MTKDFLLDKSDPKYRDHRDHLLAALSFSDLPLIVSIKTKTEKRSVSANKYYWGYLLIEISEETGINPNDLHYFFKEKFIPWVRFGDDFSVSTADMTKKEFWEYTSLIRQFANEFLHMELADEYSVNR